MEDKEYSSSKRKRGDDRNRSDDEHHRQRPRWSDSKTEREGSDSRERDCERERCIAQVSSSNKLSGVLMPSTSSSTSSLPIVVQPKPSKAAPVLRLDALGREVDEHGNVLNKIVPSLISTLKVNINRQKKEEAFKIKPELDDDQLLVDKNPYFDARLGTTTDQTKLLRPKKKMALTSVEQGKWSSSKGAEIIRALHKSQSGQVSKAKEQLIKAKQAKLLAAKAPDIVVEWWDVPFLQSAAAGTYGDLNEETIYKMEKITIYVEHPRPIEPPAEPSPPPPQPLKLTNKERKKLRTQRRLAREKDRQEMIRLGVLEPPKPKLKMSNLMKVVGSQATRCPTKLEMEIRSSVAEREQAHIDRKIARKLTPAERRQIKEKKFFHNLNTAINVSIYKIINGLSSHPQARYKVDINAQENRLTGCAVNISQGICIVVVEGGAKWIKKYEKLMLARIDWTAPLKKEEEDENDDEEKPLNNCALVWQGSVAKPSFTKFLVRECKNETDARKYFLDHGVAHYWDLAINFTEDTN